MMVISREKMGVLEDFVHRNVLAWPVFTGSHGGSSGMSHWGWGAVVTVGHSDKAGGDL